MPDALPTQIQPGAIVQRKLQIAAAVGAINETTRTVELAFSSETPIDQGWGIEILDHSPRSVRLDRLKRSGPLLLEHNRADQIGVVRSVVIGADRVARAMVEFSKSVRASEIFQDVVDGIRAGVSVSCLIFGVILESETDGVPTYRITDWEPYEISIVSVPADIEVGVGRSAKPPTRPQGNPMPQENPPTPTPAPTITNDPQRTGADNERKRSAEIIAIADQYSRFNLEKIARDAVTSGMSVEEFRSRAMDAMAAAPKPTAEIGMSAPEVKRYSLLRALNHLANPTDKRARAAAGFEIECSTAAAERSAKTPTGLLVPYDVLQRDLTKGVATAGGNTVATVLQAGSFIEMLRNAMVIHGLGARTLAGLVGDIAIPKQTGGGTAYWVTESGAPTESEQMVDQIKMAPKTVGAYTDISRKLLIQSSIDVESFVQLDLATTLGLAIQGASITGGGANEPKGVLAIPGIGNIIGGANGAAPTWKNIVALETAVSVANANVGTLAYLTNSKVRGALKCTERFAGSSGMPVWSDGNTPLNGYAAAVTNAVPSNLDKGTAADVCSAILFGNWADLIIGLWGGLDLTVDPYTHSTSGAVRVVTLQDVDVGVRHSESFAAMKDALTD